MPTLFRLLTILAVIAAIIYGIMAALVYFVEPTRRELTVDVPLPELTPIRPEPAPAEPGPEEGETSEDGTPATGESGASTAGGGPDATP